MGAQHHFPVDGGLDLAEGTYIARRIHENGSLVAMDLVEVNPGVETGASGLSLTLRSGCDVIWSAMGVV